MAVPPITSLDPASAAANSHARAFKRALHIFKEAAARVPAYKAFLKRAKIRPETILTEADFAQVPPTDKPGYFSRYGLDELSWDGTIERAKYVSTSSGSTGAPFFWPRGQEQDTVIGLFMRRIYEDIFGARRGTTLFVNSFSLGTWIAGMEFFNGARAVAEAGDRVTIVSPGIDKYEAVNQIRKLAPLYDRVVLAGYPPFVKDIIEHGTNEGVRWKDIDLKIMFAGESVLESWRDRVLMLAGKKPDDARAINIYGMAESGVVAHETPASIYVRRAIAKLSPLGVPASEHVMGLYQYYPLARYFETNGNDSLLLTANAGLPLIRYSTRDNGGVLAHEEVARMLGKNAALMRWRLPFVYLFGRKDLSLSLYAVNVYIENVKLALERSRYTERLSGLFTMSVEHKRNLDQRFRITIELAEGQKPRAALAHALEKHIASVIKSVNSEYAKLHSVVGKKADPHITLVAHGEIATIPGKKHRWVKRS